MRRLRRRPRSSGFTLLEATVSVTILAVVLQASVSATLVMSRSADFGGAELEQSTRARDALRGLAVELRTSSREVDASGTPYMAVAGTEGSETLTFRRVADFGSNGSEVVPRWSTPITIALQGGQLVRTQGGTTVVLANGVETLDFEIDAIGRVDARVGIARTSKADGQVAREQHHFRASPQR
jgi:type II secretory pathway pseudopilin PulG